MNDAIQREATAIYGPDAGGELASTLRALAEEFRSAHARDAVAPEARMSERDAVLITYADLLQTPGEAPLRTLARWLDGPLADTVSTVHLLPFYPWSSDDGFSVKAYREVEPSYGTWDDVNAVGAHHRLMFDAVINHASAQGAWFDAYLQGTPPYRDWFRSERPDADLSSIVRPRTTPLLTRFEAHDGARWLWTTFGPDQVDLDYRTPSLVAEIASILLFYVRHGADVLRMDAVTFLWKELGTRGVHHEHTHGVLRLLRAVLEAAAPWTVMLTETNVPHAENLSYFGNGRDEAQMVYNFALPPLLLHTLTSGDTDALRAWATTLDTPNDQTWFLNFLASHDGIGVRSVEGLLPRARIDDLVARTRRLGGEVGMKREADGSLSPYELSINFLDALRNPDREETPTLEVARFAAAHAVAMALPGVPAIYLHSLLGSRGAPHLSKATGMPRSINREKLDAATVQRELDDPTSLRARTLRTLRTLLRARRVHPAFNPSAPSRVVDAPNGVFALERGADARVIAVHELAGRSVAFDLDTPGHDLLSGERLQPGTLELEPYAVRWIALT